MYDLHLQRRAAHKSAALFSWTIPTTVLVILAFLACHDAVLHVNASPIKPETDRDSITPVSRLLLARTNDGGGIWQIAPYCCPGCPFEMCCCPGRGRVPITSTKVVYTTRTLTRRRTRTAFITTTRTGWLFVKKTTTTTTPVVRKVTRRDVREVPEVPTAQEIEESKVASEIDSLDPRSLDSLDSEPLESTTVSSEPDEDLSDDPSIHGLSKRHLCPYCPNNAATPKEGRNNGGSWDGNTGNWCCRQRVRTTTTVTKRRWRIGYTTVSRTRTRTFVFRVTPWQRYQARLFADTDGDNVYTEGVDLPLANTWIRLFDGSAARSWAQTNSTGQFIFNIYLPLIPVDRDDLEIQRTSDGAVLATLQSNSSHYVSPDGDIPISSEFIVMTSTTEALTPTETPTPFTTETETTTVTLTTDTLTYTTSETSTTTTVTSTTSLSLTTSTTTGPAP